MQASSMDGQARCCCTADHGIRDWFTCRVGLGPVLDERMGRYAWLRQRARLKGEPDVDRRRVGLQSQRAQVDAGIAQKARVAQGVRVQHPQPQPVQRLRMHSCFSARLSFWMLPAGPTGVNARETPSKQRFVRTSGQCRRPNVLSQASTIAQSAHPRSAYRRQQPQVKVPIPRRLVRAAHAGGAEHLRASADLHVRVHRHCLLTRVPALPDGAHSAWATSNASSAAHVTRACQQPAVQSLTAYSKRTGRRTATDPYAIQGLGSSTGSELAADRIRLVDRHLVSTGTWVNSLLAAETGVWCTYASTHRSSRACTTVSCSKPPGPPLRLVRYFAQTRVMSVNLRFGSIMSFASTV